VKHAPSEMDPKVDQVPLEVNQGRSHTRERTGQHASKVMCEDSIQFGTGPGCGSIDKHTCTVDPVDVIIAVAIFSHTRRDASAQMKSRSLTP